MTWLKAIFQFIADLFKAMNQPVKENVKTDVTPPIENVNPIKPKSSIPTREEMLVVVLDLIEGRKPNRLGIAYKLIREDKGKNRSTAIDALILKQGGSLGDAYCQFGQQELLDELCLFYKLDRKDVDIPEGGGTQRIYDKTDERFKTANANALCWVTWSYGNGKGHVGILLAKPANKKLSTFEFNTSASGDEIVRDGQGAEYCTRPQGGGKFGDVTVTERGFIDIYAAIVEAMLKKAEPPTITNSVNQITLPWDGKHQDTQKWTAYLKKHIEDSSLLTLTPVDVPQLSKATRSQRLVFWMNLFSIMTKYESGFKPETKYTEDGIVDANGKNVVSRGLLQISIESARSYGNVISKEEELHDPSVNLSAGVKIMEKLVSKHGRLAGFVDGKWKGGSAYWSVLRETKDGKPRESYAAIFKHMKSLVLAEQSKEAA